MKVPFNIKYREQIESGEYRVETRDGRKVEIMKWDAKGRCPIIALVTESEDMEAARHYYEDGTDESRNGYSDLFVIKDEAVPTEFENALLDIVMAGAGINSFTKLRKFVVEKSQELLSIARKEFEEEVPRWTRCNNNVYDSCLVCKMIDRGAPLFYAVSSPKFYAISSPKEMKEEEWKEEDWYIPLRQLARLPRNEQ